MSETITLKESIERRLAQRVQEDPALLAQLQASPDEVLKPMIAEVLGDDGGLDLSAVSTSVHVETANSLQFVVTVPDDDAEVAGYALESLDVAGSLRTGSIAIGSELGGDALFGRKTSKKRCQSVAVEHCELKDPWG